MLTEASFQKSLENECVRSAVVVAPGYLSSMAALMDDHGACLLPLLDRPFLQHVVELVVSCRIGQVDFILSHLPERVESFFGDGSRWGARFQYHLARDAVRPYDLLKVILDGRDAPVLLAHAHTLPLLAPDMLVAPPPDSIQMFCASDGTGRACWTGWSLAPARVLAALPGSLDAAALEALLTARGAPVAVPRALQLKSFHDMLEAQQTVLQEDWPGLQRTGREASAGVRLGRNVTVHPTAQLIPPVFIGENCQVGAGAVLGPYVTVGRDSVVETRCSAENSLILPGAYVGENLELRDAVVDTRRLINVRLGTSIPVTEPSILGSLGPRRDCQPGGLPSRVAAALLLALVWPILLVTVAWQTGVRRGRGLHAEEVLLLPAESDDVLWRTFRFLTFAPLQEPLGYRSHFLLRFLPGLVHVARGEMHLVGLPARSRAWVRDLPGDWRAFYHLAPAGLVSEAFLNFGIDPSPQEQFAADAHYAVRRSPAYNLKLLLSYLWSVAAGRQMPGEG